MDMVNDDNQTWCVARYIQGAYKEGYHLCRPSLKPKNGFADFDGDSTIDYYQSVNILSFLQDMFRRFIRALSKSGRSENKPASSLFPAKGL